MLRHRLRRSLGAGRRNHRRRFRRPFSPRHPGETSLGHPALLRICQRGSEADTDHRASAGLGAARGRRPGTRFPTTRHCEQASLQQRTRSRTSRHATSAWRRVQGRMMRAAVMVDMNGQHVDSRRGAPPHDHIRHWQRIRRRRLGVVGYEPNTARPHPCTRSRTRGLPGGDRPGFLRRERARHPLLTLLRPDHHRRPSREAHRGAEERESDRKDMHGL